MDTDEFAARSESKIKPYRSHAERIALMQRNIQIALSVVILIFAVLGFLAEKGVV